MTTITGLRRTLITALALSVALVAGQARASDGARLEALEQEVAALKQELGRAHPAGPGEGDRFAELERRIALLAAELERLELGEAAAAADTLQHGFGPAASKVYRAGRGVSLGGYGEMLYEHVAADQDDGSPSGRGDRIDFLRAIVYIGYKFTDRLLFNSELEFEHASTEDAGAVSVEFAYVDYLWRPQLNLRAGMLLVPMGLLNELHEPTLFLSTARPGSERTIIPSTWRENGVGIFGDAGPFAYRSYVVNGFRADGFSSAGLRGGRQRGSQASAEDFAWVGRIDYTGRPGLVAGGSLYAGGSGQALADADGRDIGATTTLTEAHLEWKWRGLALRLLGTQAHVDDVRRLNEALELDGAASIGERLRGGYVELGYDLLAERPRGQLAVIPFLRWESLDTQSLVPAGFERNPAREVDTLTLGVAWRPIDQLVIKADFQDVDNAAGTGVNQFNVALGYIF